MVKPLQAAEEEANCKILYCHSIIFLRRKSFVAVFIVPIKFFREIINVLNSS